MTTEPIPTDVLADFHGLVDLAIIRAKRAMVKFPQPNYVITKIAEEAGEVIKEAVHCAEGRGSYDDLTDEMIDAMAMLFRLWAEGDGKHGLDPVSPTIRAARGKK